MSLDGVDMVSSIAMPLDEVVFLVVDPLFLDGVILALASRWAFSLDGVILALASCWAFVRIYCTPSPLRYALTIKDPVGGGTTT
jgi:hypothetical protein